VMLAFPCLFFPLFFLFPRSSVVPNGAMTTGRPVAV
jgi:hypothetical protein